MNIQKIKTELLEWAVGIGIAGVLLFLLEVFRASGNWLALIGFVLIIVLMPIFVFYGIYWSWLEIELNENKETCETNKTK